MYTPLKVTITTVAMGVAALSLTAPANAGGSDVGAGLAGFGIGAIVGSALAPQTVYVAPPPPVYYAPPPPVLCSTATCGLRRAGIRAISSPPPSPSPLTACLHHWNRQARVIVFT